MSKAVWKGGGKGVDELRNSKNLNNVTFLLSRGLYLIMTISHGQKKNVFSLAGIDERK